MNAELVLQLIGGAGFLAGVAAILHFLNTRTSTRTKGSAEASQAYRQFVSGAFDDRDREHERVIRERDNAWRKVDLLLDLAQDFFVYARTRGINGAEMEPFEDRLDSARRL